MAYRGRVLVELSTQLEGKADKEVDKMSNDDILVVQVKKLPSPDCALVWQGVVLLSCCSMG